MYTPRVRLRMTAYHIVDASSGAWIRSQGRVGGSVSVAAPTSISCRLVAT